MLAKKLAKTVKAIAKVTENRYKKVGEELKKMNPDKGKIDSHRFRKMKKKLFPKNRDLPSAMLDKFNNFLTTQESIEARAVEVYSERLQPNIMKDHLKLYEENSNKLSEIWLKLLRTTNNDPWTPDDLKKAVKDLLSV